MINDPVGLLLERIERRQKFYEKMTFPYLSSLSEKADQYLERLNRIDETVKRMEKIESIARKTLYPEHIRNFGIPIVQQEYLDIIHRTGKIFKDYDDLNSRALATMGRFSDSFGALPDNQQSEIMSVAFELGVPMIENLIEKNELSAESKEKSLNYDIASRITVVEVDKAKSWISRIPKELTQAFFMLRRALYPVIHEQPTMICSLFIGISTSLFMRGSKEESVLYMAIAGLFWIIDAWGNPDE